MKSRCGGVAERKGDYVASVKRNTPGMVQEMTWVLEYIRITGRYKLHFVRSLLDSIIIIGIIFFTTGDAAHATTQTRPEGRCPPSARVSSPTPGEGHRRTVPLDGVLRPARPVTGQVRDAAPCPGGRTHGQSQRDNLRVVAPIVLPGQSGLRTRRLARAASKKAGAAPGSQVIREDCRDRARDVGQGARHRLSHFGRAGRGTFWCLGPSTQHRARPGSTGKKRRP